MIYVNLAVEEEILHGGPMTSVINISRDSRINWPGNSVYLYHPTSRCTRLTNDARPHEPPPLPPFSRTLSRLVWLMLCRLLFPFFFPLLSVNPERRSRTGGAPNRDSMFFFFVMFVHTHTFMFYTPGSTPPRDKGCAGGEPAGGDGVGELA